MQLANSPTIRKRARSTTRASQCSCSPAANGDIANALADRGILACDEADCQRARSLFEESMVIFGELGDIRGVARLLEGFLGLAIVQDQPERVLRLAGIANTLRKKHGV